MRHYIKDASLVAMTTDRVTTVRLPVEVAEVVELMADVKGTTVSSEIRESVIARVRANLADPEFRAHLDEILERRKALIERLAKQ